MKLFHLKTYQAFIILFTFYAFYYYFFAVVRTPIILADESGYIATARYLVNHNGLIDLRNFLYYPGISIVYAPIFLLTDDLQSAYKGFQIINLISATLIPMFLYKILKKIFTADDLNMILISLVSALYATVFCYVNLALPEVLMTLSFLILVFLLLQIEQEFKKSYLFYMIAVTFFLFLLHPRSIIFSISLLFFTYYFIYDKKWILFLFILLIVTSLTISKFLVSLLSEQYEMYRLDSLSLFCSQNTSFSLLIKKNFYTFSKFLSLILEILGQVWYLTISSLGLVWIGFSRLVLNIKNNHYRSTSLFLIMSSLGILLLSSMFMNGAPRGDHQIYGRYNEFIWFLLLVIGFYEIISNKWKDKHLYWFFSYIFVILLSYIIFHKTNFHTLSFNPNNILGIYIYYFLFKSHNILYISLTAFIFMGILVYGRAKHVGLSMLILITYFMTNNYLILYKYYKPGSDSRLEQNMLSKYINKFIVDKNTTIAYDVDSWSFWHYFNYQMYSPDIQLVLTKNPTEQEKKFQFIISKNQNIGEHYRLVALENHFHQYLHRRIDNISPKSLSSKKNSLTISENDAKYTFKNIDIHTNILDFVLSHEGNNEFWPNLYGLKKPEFAVRIGLLYIDNNFKPIFESRSDLSETIYPHEYKKISIKLPKKCKADYVKIDLIQEGVAWFESYGNVPILLECKNRIYKLKGNQ